MDAITDPADWAGTKLAALANIDSLLRCQICKDFFTTPLITSCSHTFCAVCIRRSLSVDGACPSCRTREQESKLRRNAAIEEIVDVFTRARDGLKEVAQEVNTGAPQADPRPANRSPTSTLAGSKRKRRHDEDQAAAEISADSSLRAPRTRAQRKAAADPSTSQNGNGSTVSSQNHYGSPVRDSDTDMSTYDPASSPDVDRSRNHTSARDHNAKPVEGLVSCPICHKRMKEELVYSHLDSCTGQDRSTTLAAPLGGPAQQMPTKNPSKPPERLPQISYSLLKDNALRRKLADLKIPSWGPRALLIRRHSEWLALWNANCDSKSPRSRKELERELDAWERSQGGRSMSVAPSGVSDSTHGNFVNTSQIMDKTFDVNGWAKQNKTDFQNLIEKAKGGAKQAGKSKDMADGVDHERSEDAPHQLDSLEDSSHILQASQQMPQKSSNDVLAEKHPVPNGHLHDFPNDSNSPTHHQPSASAQRRRSSIAHPIELPTPTDLSDSATPSIFAASTTTANLPKLDFRSENSTVASPPGSRKGSRPTDAGSPNVTSPPSMFKSDSRSSIDTDGPGSSGADTRKLPPPPASLIWLSSNPNNPHDSARQSMASPQDVSAARVRSNSSAASNGAEDGRCEVRKKPMFQVASDPVLDSDIEISGLR